MSQELSAEQAMSLFNMLFPDHKTGEEDSVANSYKKNEIPLEQLLTVKARQFLTQEQFDLLQQTLSGVKQSSPQYTFIEDMAAAEHANKIDEIDGLEQRIGNPTYNKAFFENPSLSDDYRLILDTVGFALQQKRAQFKSFEKRGYGRIEMAGATEENYMHEEFERGPKQD